jgi:hypothetical protein
LSSAEHTVAAAPAPQRPRAVARLQAFVDARHHDFPGVLALATIAVLEVVANQVLLASNAINQYGVSALMDGHYQPELNVGVCVGCSGGSGGLATILLPFVIVAWLLGKRRPIRVMFAIAIWAALINVVGDVIGVLGTITAHVGNVGAATLLVNAGLLWIMNVVVFALWYWSTDAGGPDLRGTASARRPDFDFPQQRYQIHGWEGWTPGFHDYFHAAFTTSLTFHAGGAEILSGRTKVVNMLQSTVSVSILLLLVAKAIATFTPGG